MTRRSTLLRLLPALFLVGLVAGLFASTRAAAGWGAPSSVSTQVTLLEIKAHTRNLQVLALGLADRIPLPLVQSKAQAVAYWAKQLHDRAEKLLLP